jgi:hypothetical protein
MLYSPVYSPASSVSGRQIAHGKGNAVQRALLAADIVRGKVALHRPTMGQAASLLKVCPSYVAAAVAIGDDIDARIAVLRGRRPLIVPPVKAEPETLAKHFSRASKAERVEAARELGAGTVWDEMLNPLLT